MPIAVSVDGIVAHAGGHELRSSHRAGVRTHRRAGVNPLLTCEQQILRKLAREIFAARGIVEGQRAERIEYTIAAHDAAVEGLDTGDGEQVFGRHTPLERNALQRRLLLIPQREACLDPRPVMNVGGIPTSRACARRDARSGRNGFLRHRIAQHRGDGLALKALLREARDELPDFGTRDIQFLGRSRPGAEQHEEETCGAGSEP